jgi:hypothetical protein
MSAEKLPENRAESLSHGKNRRIGLAMLQHIRENPKKIAHF